MWPRQINLYKQPCKFLICTRSPSGGLIVHVCMCFSSQVRSLFWAQNLFCSIELMCSEQSLWLVALETHTVLFRCGGRGREREKMRIEWRRGRWGRGCTGKSKKKGKEMKADWLVEGGWAIFSQHYSLYLFHCLSLYFSLSLFLLSRTIPSLSLSAEGEGRRGGCKCERKQESVLRER